MDPEESPELWDPEDDEWWFSNGRKAEDDEDEKLVYEWIARERIPVWPPESRNSPAPGAI